MQKIYYKINKCINYTVRAFNNINKIKWCKLLCRIFNNLIIKQFKIVNRQWSMNKIIKSHNHSLQNPNQQKKWINNQKKNKYIKNRIPIVHLNSRHILKVYILWIIRKHRQKIFGKKWIQQIYSMIKVQQ